MRFQRRRFFATVALLMLLSLIMAACGSAATPSPVAQPTATTGTAANPTTASAPAPTTAAPAPTTAAAPVATTAPAQSGPKTKISFWTNNRHDLNFMKEQIELYNKTNPDNIEVEYTVRTEDYRQTMELAWQGKQAPDLFTGNGLITPTLVKAKLVEPLDGYLTADMKTLLGNNSYIEGHNAFDGKIYFLPNYGTTFRLIYNKDLFKKAGLTDAPKTVTQMVEYAKKLTEAGKADGAYGFAINLKTPSNAWNRSIQTMAQHSGTHQYDFKNGQFNFSGYKPFLMAFRQMIDDGSMFPSYQSLDIDPLRSQFAEGKIGMYLSISAEAGVYNTQFPAKIEWAAAPQPTLESEPKGATPINPVNWISMNSQSKNKDKAAKVIQWLYRKELLTAYHEKGLGISVLPEVLKVAKEPDLKGIKYFVPGKTDALWPVTPALSKVEGKDVFTVMTEIVYGVETDVDKALNELGTRYNKALNDGIANGSIQKVVLPDFDPIKLQSK